MKQVCILLIFILITSVGFSQSIEKYSRVKVFATEQGFQQLAELGIPIDHGHKKSGMWIISAFSESQIQLMETNGFQLEILIPDLKKHYLERNEATQELKSYTLSCDQEVDIETPANFSLGTMGGFYKYNEMLSHLDNMATLYPALISSKSPISTFKTYENRDIYWVRISNNPTVDEMEPGVLYTAIHHAREPGSMIQMIYYMYYLLENYSTNAEIQYLVDNLQMYFIPCINPDGYIYNETTDPSGGGYWRKNRRDNGDGTFGVDLNRNYSYAWGGTGSSGMTSSDTYRGTAAFSEPETQAVKWFVENYDVKYALNYHTYSNLLLHPFGYAVGVPTVEHDYFTNISSLMVSQNNYTNQISSGLYAAAGDSDDWMYGDTSTKPKIYAFTPEVGGNDDGFWPFSSNIEGLCNENAFMNIMTARLVLDYAFLEDKTPTIIESSGYINYDITRLGLADPANFTVSVTPIIGISSVGASNTHTGLVINDLVEDSISFTLSSGLVDGDEIRYVLSVDNGTYTYHDSITKVFGATNIALAEDGSNLDNWSTPGSSTWGTTTTTYVSASSSFADSPSGNYSNNRTNVMQFVDNIDLTDALGASISFWAKWDIEQSYDYAQILGNSGGVWTPLCGKYTKPGGEYQPSGQPLYEGVQSTWVKEEINLEDFLGDNLRIAFQMVSDGGVVGDGIYIDDVEIKIIGEVDGVLENPSTPIVLQNIPNPAVEYTYINYNFPSVPVNPELRVFNSLGQLVKTVAIPVESKNWKLDVTGFHGGVYFYQIMDKNMSSGLKKMIVVK